MSVDALAAASQQRAVGRILNQCMLEYIGCLRRSTADVDQFRFDQLVQGIVERRPLDRRYRFQQGARELASDGRADLGRLLDRRQPIEARGQRVLQGRRDRKRRQRRGQHVGAARLPDKPGFQHALGQFFHEQRNAVGLRQYLFKHLGRQLLAGRHAIDHRFRFLPVEPVQGDGRDVVTAPGRREFRARGDHHQDRQIAHAFDHPGRQVE